MYELGFYIPEDDILHSHRRENLKSFYISVFTSAANRNSTFGLPHNLLFSNPCLVTGKFVPVIGFRRKIHFYKETLLIINDLLLMLGVYILLERNSVELSPQANYTD
jgi:hypothetical protein